LRSDRSNPTATYHGEEGISPVISTILMICLAVVIVMIVATLILSEPLPDETPYAAIFARNESGNFTLAHMAGDPLKEGAYRIYVDTINGLIDETANFTGLKDGIWSAGEILTYNGMEELERVVITAISGGTEMILADLGPGGRSRGTTPTETATPTPTPTPTPTQKDALLNTGTGKSGTLAPDGYLEFKVTGLYSKVKIDNTQYDLIIDDTVKLMVGTKGKGRIFTNWPMITTFDYDDVTLYINGELKRNGQINEIYISNHTNLISTLTLDVPPFNGWTKLEVDGQIHIDGDDGRRIILYNLMPNTGGVMNLNNQLEDVYFVGSIASYTLG